MFTGIVSATGRVHKAGSRLVIEAPTTVRRSQIGSSVAVNGACLTVVAKSATAFEADVVEETLSRTNLGQLQAGQEVNLELPLTLRQPLDGHLLQGHVDGVGEVVEMNDEGQGGKRLTVALPKQLARYVAEKGSIAVDGVSLTVTKVKPDSFEVALIPHTLEVTIARTYREGSTVNLEVDLIARYLERLAPRAGI